MNPFLGMLLSSLFSAGSSALMGGNQQQGIAPQIGQPVNVGAKPPMIVGNPYQQNLTQSNQTNPYFLSMLLGNQGGLR